MEGRQPIVSQGAFLGCGRVLSSIRRKAADGKEVIPPATETLSIYTDMFWQIMLFAVGAGLLLIMLGPLFLKRWLHGVK